MSARRVLFLTKSNIFVYEEYDLRQTIELNDEKVAEMIKFSRGFLLRTQNDKLKVYIEDANETTFSYLGLVELELSTNDTIHTMHLSANS